MFCRVYTWLGAGEGSQGRVVRVVLEGKAIILKYFAQDKVSDFMRELKAMVLLRHVAGVQKVGFVCLDATELIFATNDAGNTLE